MRVLPTLVEDLLDIVGRPYDGVADVVLGGVHKTMLDPPSGPWRKLAEMNGSCFNEQVWPHQDAEGDLHDRTSFDAPGPRDSWTEGTPHFHSACYEGALSGIGGWRGDPPPQKTPGGGGGVPRAPGPV